MRRRLMLTVAAAVSMVLLAMLVPLGVLLRGYALEDRLARAALEVQTTETVVSSQDKGTVSGYLERINRDDDIQTTVFYPDGQSIGPDPTEDASVAFARRTGQARLDDVDGGAEFLVPVSLGSGAGPEQTPVIQVRVQAPGLESDLVRSWLVLLGLGLALLLGALLLADRLGRSFVRPIEALAANAHRLGDRQRPTPVRVRHAPKEVRELAASIERLVARVETLLERERAGVADLSHRLRTPMTALRLRVDAVDDPEQRSRLTADLDELAAMVDHVVREARRSEREGLVAGADAVAVLGERARFWEPLAEDQQRPFTLTLDAGPLPVRASADDLVAVLDVLLDNAFTHTPEDAGIWVSVAADNSSDNSGAVLTVEDAGPGYPDDVDVAGRGTSGADSTGLGLSIVARTAGESGGGLELGRSGHGGARARIRLGRP